MTICVLGICVLPSILGELRLVVFAVDPVRQIFFFFSSRSRHTRLVSDWSSDVCSSDLTPAHKDILAGFSGQGPTKIDFALKPDVTSVGVNVLSSITCVNKGPNCPGDGSGWAFFQGTSMSTDRKSVV